MLGILKDWSSLTKLSLWYHPLPEPALAQLSGLSRLSLLCLSNCELSPSAVLHFSASKNLDQLIFDAPKASDADTWASIAKAFPRLTIFHASLTGPRTREDLRVLGQFRNLRTLQLERDPSDDAVRVVLDLPDLEHFRLKFGDGAIHLTPATYIDIASHKKLTELVFANAVQFNDESLMAMAGMKQLKTLILSNATQLTPAGIEAFKKKRPDVTFTR